MHSFEKCGEEKHSVFIGFRKEVYVTETRKPEAADGERQNEMDMDRHEGMEELSFVPSAVSDPAGPQKARFVCDRGARKRLQVV